MITILVVDDSPVDRRLVGELLSKNPTVQFQYEFDDAETVDNKSMGELAAGAAAVQVEYAVDGRDALSKISHHAPDLVITDLQMPEINGLQLVGAIRENYPQIPVILMTSQGSEEIAVQALQQGAASYVPKRLLMRYLWETIEKVLQVSVQDRGQARLLHCMLRTESIFHLENDPALFEPLVRYLQEETMRLGVCTEADRVRVGVALEEALANSLYHGNLELDSESRSSPGYREMVQQRSMQPGYQERASRWKPASPATKRPSPSATKESASIPRGCPIPPIRRTSRRRAAAASSSCGPSWTKSATTIRATRWCSSNGGQVAMAPHDVLLTLRREAQSEQVGWTSESVHEKLGRTRRSILQFIAAFNRESAIHHDGA